MSLDRELAVYHEYLPRWLAEGRKGQWVCIYGDEVLGFYQAIEYALTVGWNHALAEAKLTGQPERPFLVRQITDESEPVRFFSRNVAGQQEAREAQVRAEEREACARLCEGLADEQRQHTGNRLDLLASAYEEAARLIRDHAERERLFGQMEERLAEDGGVWPDDTGPER